MPNVFRLVGISGSLRKESWNTKLLKAFGTVSAEEEIPVYNGDLEADVPSAVLDFKKIIAEADGIILITPEYNYSVPGALKNAIDWASRPSFSGPNAWKNKVIGIGGVGPQSYEGAHGGLLAALALRQSTYFLEWKIIDSPKLHVIRAAEKFTPSGELKPEEKELWEKVRTMMRNVVNTSNAQKVALAAMSTS